MCRAAGKATEDEKSRCTLRYDELQNDARTQHGNMGKGVSLSKEIVLADSGRTGEVAAGVGRVKRATLSASY